MKKLAILLTLGTVAACDLDVPDLNNPALDDLEKNPTASGVESACTGLLIGQRRNHAQANGYVAQLGIVGREAYNFDQADPRFIGELLQGNLAAGSPFGGNFWAGPYANIRLANTVLKATDKVADFSAEQKAGIVGFVKTTEAIDLLEVIVTRDDIGAVIDTDRPIDGPLGPIVDKDAVYAKIATLLDEGATSLTMAGDSFVFALSNGYAGFDDPASYRTFNRAIRARVAVYTGDYATALTALGESFINPTPATQADLDVGVYYSYSLGSGDAVNNLINPNIFAHPSLKTDAQTGDLRLDRKVATTDMPGSAQGHTSDLVFTLYPGPDSPVPLIRNEELILLRSEAEWFSGMKTEAMADLNVVRTKSGGLTAISGTPTSDAQYIDDLLYEREFSLLFEGGHRESSGDADTQWQWLHARKPAATARRMHWPWPWVPWWHAQASPVGEAAWLLRGR